MKRIILVALFVPMAAWGQQPPQKPEMVLIPRQVAQAALSWIMTPDPTMAVRLFSVLQACMADNPDNGRITRMGPDQCTDVTEALAARDKEIADLKKQIDDAKPPAPK